MTSTTASGKSAFSRREKVPSPRAIGLAAFVYFFGALAIYTIDPVYLLGAWGMGGGLLVTVYLTRDAKGSLLNPYTLFFATVVAICLAGYAVSKGF